MDFFVLVRLTKDWILQLNAKTAKPMKGFQFPQRLGCNYETELNFRVFFA